MNKKLVAFVVAFCAIISFNSCINDDDNNTVSEEWKAYNDKQIRETSSNTEYTSLKSESENGSVYWKSIDDFVTQSVDGTITDDRKPIFSDSISMRYEGWYYRLDGTKYTFDSTEGDRNGIPSKIRVNQLIDGFNTKIQDMKIDQQVEVCIPYMLGYGINGMYSGTTQVIP
ncbi:MAG: FKBP-type peptidyl-prolyl cis-trans isomerase, partial [Prevotella sp.]|nr:FKBP-type peptidyl-prolyl cis-trans isomerase [Prevotella sp.]